MARVRDLDRKQRRKQGAQPAPAREALLAAMLLHLRAGDLVSAPPADETLRSLSPRRPDAEPGHDLPANLRLPLCAGAARGMQAAGVDHLTVAFSHARVREPLWADALAWAHRDHLPLIFVCAESQATPRASRTRSAEAPLTWSSVAQQARKLRMPLFPVDGQDAVAVYRVMQEITGRARANGGPSVVWAVLAEPTGSRSELPLARLEAYLKARKIPLRT